MLNVDSQDDRDSLSDFSNKSIRQYSPVLLHSGSIWRRYVLDVEGNVVRCGLGLPVNVYRPDFRDILQERSIRFVYDVSREFRFVTTSDAQHNQFTADVVYGATVQNKCYHVYYDDDVSHVRLLRSRRFEKRQGV